MAASSWRAAVQTSQDQMQAVDRACESHATASTTTDTLCKRKRVEDSRLTAGTAISADDKSVRTRKKKEKHDSFHGCAMLPGTQFSMTRRAVAPTTQGGQHIAPLPDSIFVAPNTFSKPEGALTMSPSTAQLLYHRDAPANNISNRDCVGTSYSELDERYVTAQFEISRLNEVLATEQQARELEEGKIRQDMFLGFLKEKEKWDRKTFSLEKEKFCAKRVAEQFQRELEALRLVKDEVDQKLTVMKAEITMLREERDHYQHLSCLMKDDLETLRAMENADAAMRKRQQQNRSLPPAYGSLDDEDYLAPCQLHKDGGSFSLTAAKYNVRSEFLRQISIHEDRMDAAKRMTHFSIHDATLMESFTRKAVTLADACRNLKAVVENSHLLLRKHAKTIVQQLKQYKTPVHLGPLGKSRNNLRPLEFVSDGVANLIIELCWRFASSAELRGAPHWITGTDSSARCALSFSEVDDTLLAALRQSFFFDPASFESTDSSLESPYTHRNNEDIQQALPTLRRKDFVFEIQNFLTQIDSLRDQFRRLNIGLRFDFLGKSILWLEQLVEVERSLRAVTDEPVEHYNIQAMNTAVDVRDASTALPSNH